MDPAAIHTGASTVVSIDIANNVFSIALSVLIILGILIGFVAWFIRLESKVNYLEKDHSDHKVEINASQEELKKESQHRDKAIWDKMETFQSSMNQLLQAIGELKGKLSNRD